MNRTFWSDVTHRFSFDDVPYIITVIVVFYVRLRIMMVKFLLVEKDPPIYKM